MVEDEMKDIVRVYTNDGEEVVPRRQTDGSACYDLVATHDVLLLPNSKTFVDTGLVVDFTSLSDSVVVKIHMRSSVGIKNNVTLMNGVGMIDSDYRGPDDTLKLALVRGSVARQVSGPISDAEYEAALCNPKEAESLGSMSPYRKLPMGGYINRNVERIGGQVYYVEDARTPTLEECVICKKGERIAQVEFAVIVTPYLCYAGSRDKIKAVNRGGIGSTGK